MGDVGSLPDYYWRLITNIDIGGAVPFGFWTLMSFFTITCGFAILFLTFLIYRADPENPKNRFIGMMLFTESIRCMSVSIFYAYPYTRTGSVLVFHSNHFLHYGDYVVFPLPKRTLLLH